VTAVDSHSAAALHRRLQEATRLAQLEDTVGAGQPARARRRSPARSWSLLQSLPAPGGVQPLRAEQERALRLVLSGLLESGGAPEVPCGLAGLRGPVLIVRSGPWPLLRALLGALAAQPHAGPFSVLCHVRDAATLASLGRETGLELTPVFYPRFEPFVTATLRRVLADGGWETAFVLDASKHGRGLPLEHVTSALDPVTTTYVWNGANAAFRLRPLRERLGRERYALVRGLLRWHAARAEESA